MAPEEYVRENAHTNTIENFWGIMKRGIYSTCHKVSYEHLQRYCDDFSFRYNSKSVQDNTRFSLTLTKAEAGQNTLNLYPMSQDKKKVTQKKKTSRTKKADKYKEKIKVPGTFEELINIAIHKPRKGRFNIFPAL